MMRLLRAIVDRPWKILLTSFLLALSAYLTLLAIHVVPAISHAKSYLNAINSGAQGDEIFSLQQSLNRDMDNILGDLHVPIIGQALSTFDLNFEPIKGELKALITAGPALSGISGSKKYLIAFQNSAEARGTGGILGAFAIVEFDHGKLKVLQTGSNATLKSLEELPIPMPEEYKKLYRSDPAIWQNSNLSPHFPYGAQIWMELWRLQSGQKLDGVIAIDPMALSHILNSTGPIELASGEKITADNVVYKTLSEAYQRYAHDNNARKQYLVDIMNATFTKITTSDFSKMAMARAIRNGIIENRILIYSTDRVAEKALITTKLAGYMETTPNNEFRVVIENVDASKLDYYLDKTVSIDSKACSPTPVTQMSVTVKNTLKDGSNLPAYVLTRADKTKPVAMITGQHRFLVFIYGPTKATLRSAKRSSSFAAAGRLGTERGRELLVADVDLSPGQSERITATFAGGVGSITYVDQPLVRKTKVSINDGCR